MKTQDFEVTIKLRNNHLKERRVALGLSPREFAEVARVCYPSYLDLETMRVAPIKKDRAWRKAVLAVAEYYKVLPEVLFPEEILKVTNPEVVRKASYEQIEPLLTCQITEAPQLASDILEQRDVHNAVHGILSELPEKARKVIEERYGFTGEGRTYGSMAEDRNFSTERVRQIHEKAIDDLRKKIRFGRSKAAQVLQEVVLV